MNDKQRFIHPIGIIPPQAIEFEESVLGAMMINKNSVNVVIDILKSEHFYKDANQLIFSAISSLFKKASPIDVLTVSDELKKTGNLERVGGMYAVMMLTEKVNSGLNFEYHAGVIYQKYIQRQLIVSGQELVKSAYDDTVDPFELVESHQAKVFSLTEDTHGRSFSSISDLAKGRIKEYEKKPLDGLTGVGSGLKSVDLLTSGWQPSDLIILAARPAMGKTAFALQLARNAAVINKTPVAIFSLEMSQEQLTDRLISSESGVFQDKLRRRDLSEYDWLLMNKVISLTEAPIFIDDTPGLAIQSMRAKALRMKEIHNIGLIIIDYLQLMDGGKDQKGNREQEIGKISRGLKVIAKELNIPVIALSQLSRAVESRPGGGKRPMLSDLRESGSIEQDADQVVFLYRPEYYGITEDELGLSTVGLCEAIFAKNRNGICDTAKLDFNGAVMRFKDWGSSTYESSNSGNPSSLTPNFNFDGLTNEEGEPAF